MGKIGNFLIGMILGSAAGVLAGYLFAPSDRNDFSPTYRSRLDLALDEGRAAAAAREAELLREFETIKRQHGRGSQPDSAA